MHLLYCVTAHGYGHLAQSVPILDALHARLPGLRLTMRTGLPEAVLRERLAGGYDVVADPDDFGFVMRDALNIDDEASVARYRALHAGAERRLRADCEQLTRLGVDLVFTNIGHAPLAAAGALGLPAFAASSLNWADLLEALYADRADYAGGLAPVVADMRAGYAAARIVFELVPGMPFDRFANRQRVEPIARRGVARPGPLRRALGVPDATRVLLVAFGGAPMPLDTAHWRLPEGCAAVVFAPQVVESPAVRDASRLGWSFIDLLASCDVLVTKPGYGTFAEAGFAGRDTLIVPRDVWPESPYLSRWLQGHARCVELDVARLRRGDFGAALQALDGLPACPPARGDGARQIADAVAGALSRP